MKMNKKKVFVSALAVCLIAILSMGSLAWFNSSKEITNNFLVATDEEGTPDFSVDVWEHENDEDDEADADRDGSTSITHAGNTYADILPGDTLAKDPTVENTGYYSQWIRVYVTFDEWSEIKKACEDQGISADLRTWLNVGSDWTAATDETKEVNNTIAYVYYYNDKLEKDATATVFTEVSIPGEFEQADMEYVSGDFYITIKAEALQADNTGDNAISAFATYWGK